jgi:hypothetical protein
VDSGDQDSVPRQRQLHPSGSGLETDGCSSDVDADQSQEMFLVI